MAKFESAGFPLFGLSTGGGKNGEYMALCGGGGSSKTGIKNGVILLRWKGEGKVEEVATVNLSGMAPTSLAIGKDDPLAIYCGIEEFSQKFTYNNDTKTIEEQEKFQTDFTPKDEKNQDQIPEQRIARIFHKDRLFTGGFDGCVRVWLTASDSLEKEFPHPSFNPKKSDLKSYHKKMAICDIDLYTPPSSSKSSPLLSVCYDDAKVRIFDFEKGSLLHQIDPFVPTYSFRSCRFSQGEGEPCFLFTGERKQRSPSFLSKWYIGKDTKTNALQPLSTVFSNLLHNLSFKLTFNPSHLSSSLSLTPFSHVASRKIHKSFLTTLTTTKHNKKEVLLTAAADGSMSCFFPDNLQPDGKLTMNHTFPVTGLGGCGGGGYVLSCSADHCFGVHSVLKKGEGRGVEWGVVMVVGLLVLLVAILLSFF